MSVYLGKSMDTFEDVWNMWMEYAGVSAYIHADVMSFRCFAFSCGEDIKRWFSPVQSTERALAQLCSNLGIGEECSIVPASVWVSQLAELKESVLLADVCLDVESAAVREQFYHGTPAFSLLYRHIDGRHLVYASSGIPFMELTEEQVKDKLAASKGYVVMVKMPLQIQLSPAEKVLCKGIRWRKNIAANEEGLERLSWDGVERIWDRSSSVSVQYGLMNYQIQLSKVVRFCAQEMKVSDSVINDLNSVLLNVASIYKSRAYTEIVQIDKEFWSLIEKIEEACHVRNRMG